MSKNKLPPLKNDIHLSNYGYHLKEPVASRKKSLLKASKKVGLLPVLRRVNLIRNYTASVPKNYKKLSKDVDFLKREYKKSKKSKK